MAPASKKQISDTMSTRATRSTGKRAVEELVGSDDTSTVQGAPPKVRKGDGPSLDSFEEARAFLVSSQMLPPDTDIASPRDVATVLYHVAEATATVPQFRRLIRAAAALVNEHDARYGSQMAHEAIVDQIGYMSEELKDMVAHAKATLSTAVDDTVARIEGAVGRLKEASLTPPPARQPTMSSPYRDALLGFPRAGNARPFLAGPTQESSPDSSDEDEVARFARAEARLALQTRQFLFDFPDDAPIKKASNMAATDIFNEAIGSLVGGAAGALGVRKAKHLRNGGVLGEFLTDEGARWFRIRENSTALTAALGGGAEWRPRMYSIIAFGVPHTFDVSSEDHVGRLEAKNGLAPKSIASAKWATPRQRRDPGRNASALIINLYRTADANAILECNRMKIEGRVCTTRKCHKEPGKCVRCLSWDHVVSACKETEDTCGCCAAKGHRFDACANRNRPCCKPCGSQGAGHASYDRLCPTFQRKCREYDAAHPENRAPFYPADGHESDSSSASETSPDLSPIGARWLRAWKRREAIVTNVPATDLTPAVQELLVAKADAARQAREVKRQTQLTSYAFSARRDPQDAGGDAGDEEEVEAAIGLALDASFATASQELEDPNRPEDPASPSLSYTSE